MDKSTEPTFGSDQGKMKVGPKGFTFPLVLAFMLISQLTLMGVLWLLAGHTAHLHEVSRYYQANIQWSMVKSQLRRDREEQAKGLLVQIQDQVPFLLGQVLGLSESSAMRQIDGAHYLVDLTQGPHKGERILVRVRLDLSPQLAAGLDKKAWQALAVYEPGPMERDWQSDLAALKEVAAQADPSLSQGNFIKADQQKRQGHWAPQEMGGQEWQFADGQIELGPDGKTYLNRVGDDYQRQETFDSCQGDYVLLYEFLHYKLE